jgi:hypothetical protein
MFDDAGRAYVVIDLGGLTTTLKGELAPGVDIAISAALDERRLRVDGLSS